MPLRISESKPLRQDSVESKLRERIRAEGRVSFADFMDMALYDPEGRILREPLPAGGLP